MVIFKKKTGKFLKRELSILKGSKYFESCKTLSQKNILSLSLLWFSCVHSVALVFPTHTFR